MLKAPVCSYHLLVLKTLSLVETCVCWPCSGFSRIYFSGKYFLDFLNFVGPQSFWFKKRGLLGLKVPVFPSWGIFEFSRLTWTEGLSCHILLKACAYV